MIAVRWAVGDADWRDVLALRIEVFVNEQGCPADEEPDALDSEARHLMAVAEEMVVGCARVIDKGPGKAKIGRVAVRRDRRGEGIGASIMRFALRQLSVEGCHEVSLEAQVPVIPFYERLGFVAEGPVYLDAGIPHRHMTLAREDSDGATDR
jgi:predicted GNAT family N-acyltransferase